MSSRLAAALRVLLEPESVTLEVIMGATGTTKSTASRMRADILQADQPKLSAWDGDRLERFALWERTTYDTTTIADALAGRDPIDSQTLDDVRKVREVLKAASAMTGKAADALDDSRVSTREWKGLDEVGSQLQAAVTALRRAARRNLRPPSR